MSSAETVVHPRAHDNRVRGPFNSWILEVLEGHFHRQLGSTRKEVLGQVSGEVLEVGAGNGPTLRYLPTSVTRFHAVEPNRHFHARLRRAAADHRLDLVLHDTPGEALEAGFRSVEIAPVQIATPFIPIRTQIAGVATA